MRQGGGSQYDMVSASGDASLRLISGGDVAADEREPGARMEELHPAAAVPAAQHRQRRALRHLAAVGSRTRCCTTRKSVTPAPTSWEAIYSPAVQGPGHGARQPDPDRRRRAVSVEEAAEPRHHRSVRAHRSAARRRGEACSKQQKPLIKKYWTRRRGRDRTVQERRRSDRGGVAAIRPTRSKPTTCRSRNSSRRRARPAGRTRGCSPRTPQHPNCAYKWVNWVSTPEGAGRAGDLVRRDARQHQGVPVHGRDQEGLVHALPRQRAERVLRTASSSGRRR